MCLCIILLNLRSLVIFSAFYTYNVLKCLICNKCAHMYVHTCACLRLHALSLFPLCVHAYIHLQMSPNTYWDHSRHAKKKSRIAVQTHGRTHTEKMLTAASYRFKCTQCRLVFLLSLRMNRYCDSLHVHKQTVSIAIICKINNARLSKHLQNLLFIIHSFLVLAIGILILQMQPS